jgi:hypothetical protein
MMELGDEPRLAGESAKRLVVLDVLGADQLDRDLVLRSRARYTTAVPPRPSSRTIS